MSEHVVTDAPLSLEFFNGMLENMSIRLSDDAVKKMQECREYLDRRIATSDGPVYGMMERSGMAAIVFRDRR